MLLGLLLGHLHLHLLPRRPLLDDQQDRLPRRVHRGVVEVPQAHPRPALLGDVPHDPVQQLPQHRRIVLGVQVDPVLVLHHLPEAILALPQVLHRHEPLDDRVRVLDVARCCCCVADIPPRPAAARGAAGLGGARHGVLAATHVRGLCRRILSVKLDEAEYSGHSDGQTAHGHLHPL